MRSTSKLPHSLAIFHGLAVLFLVNQGGVCSGQTQTESAQDLQDRIRIENRIQDEAVQRGSDILGVTTTTSNLATRVARLERTLLSTRPYAGMSVKESRAALRLALAERNQLLTHSAKPTQVEIAAAELSIARAESQLTITQATQKETLLLCQLDVIEAELALLQLSKKIELQQRLIARGLNTSGNFLQQKMAVSAAEKKLELMRVRHETQRILQGISNASPAGDSKPLRSSPATP
ncbi:MAG: hypothetical protein CBE00_02015 [Planctomycetaceae bacterium TMED240]|nr:hypothetical protein [Rhodopirellula sp.]OUX08301.1 MAG: hypothetical protein CBE00_02015 [Planctomycetaceae bacterium TMED240]